MQLCDWLAVINILPACDFISLELLCQQAALKRDFVNVWCLGKWCSVWMYVCLSLFSKGIQIWAVGDTIPCWHQIEEEVFLNMIVIKFSIWTTSLCYLCRVASHMASSVLSLKSQSLSTGLAYGHCQAQSQPIAFHPLKSGQLPSMPVLINYKHL